MTFFKMDLKSLTVLVVMAAVISFQSNDALAEAECAEWSRIICQQLGATALACGKMGVNLYASGLVTDQNALKEVGFKFGEGPYRMSATRIDTGRYLVSIQSMSRRDDTQEKEIALRSNADSVYPVHIPQAPEGKYTWNSAIQHDMIQQLGIQPHYEYEEEPLSFVDIRIVDPEKLASYGFPGIQKNDSNYQLLYKGNDRWEFRSAKSRNNGILVYKNAKWTVEEAISKPVSMTQSIPTSSSTSKPSPPVSQTRPQTPSDENIPNNAQKPMYFSQVESSDMVFNNSLSEFEVYESRKNGISYYLVQIQGIGTRVIDTHKKKLHRADAATPTPGGNAMLLDLEDITVIDDSGVDILCGESNKRIEACWNKNRIAFTLRKERQSALKKTGSQPKQGRPAPGLVFVNSDFEEGDLTNWMATGKAFEFQPTKGDNPTARKRKQPSNHQGEYWIGTYEKCTGEPGTKPGKIQGDHPMGTLTSIPFEITDDQISFLVGGGRWIDHEYVALIVDGEEVLKATGKNRETMRRLVWNVSAYKGKEAQILINDNFSGGWGHINADDFRYQTK